MSTDATSLPARSSPSAAERMRLHRKRRRGGLQYVRVVLHVTDIDALIRKGSLKDERRFISLADLGN